MYIKKPLNLKKVSAKALPRTSLQNWRVLVVDDDPEVHAVTRLILSKIQFKNRGIEILAAHTGSEARELLMQEKDIALILLDVVMETDDAGLEVVRYVRDELENQAIRIVLRTGQPGQAPEAQIIVDYDINDYKAKSELTAQKLFTTVIAALRGYATISSIERSRIGLKHILDSTGTLFQVLDVKEFASGVLTHLASFLECQPRGIVCLQMSEDAIGKQANSSSDLQILAATHESGCFDDETVHHHLNDRAESLVLRALVEERHLMEDDCVVLYMDAHVSKGAVVLMGSASSQMIDETDLHLLNLFVSKISLAMSNALNYQRMVHAEAEATTDYLTGLTNRRQMLHLARPLLAGARRAGNCTAVAMLDIDHFKHINDTWGHEAGDEVLRCLGAVLRMGFRASDIVARIGGEEFCIVLPIANAQHAYTLFDQLRKRVESYAFEYLDTSLPVSISCGVFCQLDGSIEPMLKRADELLYRAKHEGRNRVIANTPSNM